MVTIDLTSEILRDGTDWFSGSRKISKSILIKIEKTHKLLEQNKLSIILNILPDKFILSIKGPGDTDVSGVEFTFERMEPGIWGFGISVDDENVTLENGEIITLERQGFARYLPTIMYFLIEKKKIHHSDFSNFGHGLRIGIDTDASEGFWESMGMKLGKYSSDKAKPRDETRTGAYGGLEKEFIGNAMVEWANWVYIGKNKGSKKRKTRKKKSKKRKSKKKKSKKIITKRRSKRKSNN